MDKYVSGVRTWNGNDSLLVCIDDKSLNKGRDTCQLAFNGSSDYECYTSDGIKKLIAEGCLGLVRCDNNKYVAYRISNLWLSLSSCLKYCETMNDVPAELYNPFSFSNNPVVWNIVSYSYNRDDECLFRPSGIGIREIVDNTYLPSLILNYYSSAIKLGDMLDYNIDVLTYLSELNLDESAISDSFRYNNTLEFRGSEDEFGENGYIDCNLDDDTVYRLYRSDVFQYIGCPLYIDKDDYLYLGYNNEGSNSDTALTGAVKYKIIDRSKFDVIITKALVGCSTKLINMCTVYEHIDPSPVRLRG